jgi:hypothetical protein
VTIGHVPQQERGCWISFSTQHSNLQRFAFSLPRSQRSHDTPTTNDANDQRMSSTVRRSPGVSPHMQPQYHPVPTLSYNARDGRTISPPISMAPQPSSSQQPPRSNQYLQPNGRYNPDPPGSSLGRRDTARGVARGAIGGAFGPYAVSTLLASVAMESFNRYN